MSWWRDARRLVRHARQHRTESRDERQALRAAWAIERQIDEIISSHRTIVVGPWLSEVGFETLYWIPFLRWVKAAFRLDPSRVVAMSRGGVASWYADVASRYVEIWDEIDPVECARRMTERGTTKQLDVADFDRDLLRAFEKRAGAGDSVGVLHPSLMYRLFSLFWSGQRALNFVDAHTRFQPVTAPRILDAAQLPREYVAVKFYAAHALPDTADTRRVLASIVDRLAERTAVVLLDTGLVLDEHSDYSFTRSTRVISAKPWMTAANNLGVQTQIIAGAQAYVGTCGALAWLAPMLGTPTSAFYVDSKWVHAHLGVMLRACDRAAAPRFSVINLRALHPALSLDPVGIGHES